MKVNLRNIDYWEKLLTNMPTSYKNWFEKEKDYLQKNIAKNAKVLEVGCGEGRSIRDILPITKNITGIDYDKKAVEDAKNNFKNYPSVKIVLAEATNLPFNDESFDFVICMTTFANFGNKKYKILDEMKRVLISKGFIIISVYSEDALDERLKIYSKMGQKLRNVSKDGKVVFDEEWKDNVSEQFSKKELEEIFKKVKLRPIEFRKVEMAYIVKLKK